jgi:hypothetical protein
VNDCIPTKLSLQSQVGWIGPVCWLLNYIPATEYAIKTDNQGCLVALISQWKNTLNSALQIPIASLWAHRLSPMVAICSELRSTNGWDWGSLEWPSSDEKNMQNRQWYKNIAFISSRILLLGFLWVICSRHKRWQLWLAKIPGPCNVWCAVIYKGCDLHCEF